MVVARSVGDTGDQFTDQLLAPVGTVLTTSPTFAKALDLFDPESLARPTLPRQGEGHGGRTDTVHVEQHFEYLAPFRSGDRVTVMVAPGRVWSKDGRSGRLRFSEVITEYYNQDGLPLVRARKVSVRVEKSDE